MPTLAQVLKGKRARKRVLFPLPGSVAKQEGGFEGATEPVDLVVLSPLDLTDAHERACAFAKARGAEPKEGDPVYELALRGYTLEIALCDYESPDKAVPFATFDQLMSGDGITDAHLAYMYELHEQFQFECSPRTAKLDAETFASVTKGLVQKDYLPFLQLARGTQANYLHSLAALYVNSQRSRSLSGSNSEGSAPS